MVKADAIVALAGDYSPEGYLGDSTRSRMDVAIHLSQLGIASNLIVTGGRTFFDTADKPPLSQLMTEYAYSKGVAADVYQEDEALDTVGNAVFTKLNLTEQNNWKRLVVVTNEFHMPRSMRIFNHVMGEDYDIEGVTAPNHDFPHQRLWEYSAGMLTKLVLAHTNPGDTDAVKKRMLNIVPGYRQVSVIKRLSSIASSVIR